ncbi:hypothetical protein ACFY9N_05765 [Microbacterium sp. NPDC008134]|uniref:hypothetical protein n=1 Tax=Microbacterium sp. NPDC008134 TaxID=3364183 RepID=UPI0036E8C326
MKIRRVIAATAAATMLAGSMLFGASAGALAAGPGDWDYIPVDPEYVTGTPDGVRVWMNNCYVKDGEPTPGMLDGEVTHPGRHYGCNIGIEVSEGYEQEHGPYTVSTDAIAATATFQALGSPFAGVGGAVPCATGEKPHYIGIAAAGEAGTYGSDAGGFHVNYFDAACYSVNEFPPDPEPPVMPEPEPEEPELTPETEPEPGFPPVVVEEPAPIVDPLPQPTPEPVTPRAVPEAVKTGVGPVNASSVVSPSGRAKVSEPTDLTIRELLDLLYRAKSDVAPVLALPEPKTMPFSNVLEPATFDDLWVIDDAANGYTADGPQYFLAHTHTQGGAVGNVVNEAGLEPGTVVEVAGVRFDVTEVSTIAKPDIGTLPIWQSDDPEDAYLVVCLWNNGSLATHNLVIELHRS